MHMTNFVSQINKKNILRWVNFTNLKTPGGYIAKSKPQGVCLQLSQTPGVIMHFSLNFLILIHAIECWIEQFHDLWSKPIFFVD